MLRNRIYHVLIFLAISARVYAAGWSDAWDDASQWNVYTAQLYGIVVTDIITQASTTNYIPAGAVTGLVLGTTEYVDWPEVFTNHAGFTNVYDIELRYDYTNNLSVSTNTLFTNVSWFVYQDVTNGLTTVVSRVQNGTVREHLIDAETKRFIDLYDALSERNADYLSMFTELAKKDTYGNAERAKACALSIVTDFVCTQYLGQAELPDYSGLNYTITGILTECSLPTNYFDIGYQYTPYKSPWKVPEPVGQIVTSCTRIIQYASDTNDAADAIRTNTLWLYDGSTTNVTGTNGQLVCATCTIPGVEDTRDKYTYKHLTNIISRLRAIVKYEGATAYEYNNILGEGDEYYDVAWTKYDNSDCAYETNETCQYGTNSINTGWVVTTNTSNKGLLRFFLEAKAVENTHAYEYLTINSYPYYSGYRNTISKGLTTDFEYDVATHATNSFSTRFFKSETGSTNSATVYTYYRFYDQLNVLETNYHSYLYVNASNVPTYFGPVGSPPIDCASPIIYFSPYTGYTAEVVCVVNPLTTDYNISTSSYMLAVTDIGNVSFSGNLNDNAYFERGFVPPFSVDHLTAQASLEATLFQSAIMYHDYVCSGVTNTASESAEQTYYEQNKRIDLELKDYMHILDFAVTNGFRYY